MFTSDNIQITSTKWMNDAIIAQVTEEKHLWIVIELKFWHYINLQTKGNSQRFGMIKRNLKLHG